MEWALVLTNVLPVMFAIIIGIFYNNCRLDDLNCVIDDLCTDMKQQFANMNQRLNQRFTVVVL